jgi:hypothetical protein
MSSESSGRMLSGLGSDDVMPDADDGRGSPSVPDSL